MVVIGGGDGGTVREMLRHPEIENITLCEIDSLVVETSHHYFPEVSAGLTDPRVEVMIGDGIEYVSNLPKESVDLMIIDSTDPIGPGEGLFTKEFYRNAAASLKADGLLCAQTESPWHSRESISRIHNNLAGGFSFVRPFIGVVPTYPRGGGICSDPVSYLGHVCAECRGHRECYNRWLGEPRCRFCPNGDAPIVCDYNSPGL